jgi:hypothetical protein
MALVLPYKPRSTHLEEHPGLSAYKMAVHQAIIQ